MTVLYFLGSGIRLDADGHILKPFSDLNANVFVFDYRNFGRSDATTKEHGLKEIESDTLALYDRRARASERSLDCAWTLIWQFRRSAF